MRMKPTSTIGGSRSFKSFNFEPPVPPEEEGGDGGSVVLAIIIALTSLFLFL